MVKTINKTFIKKYKIDIGSFYFYEQYVVGEVEEGSDLNFESGKELYELIEKHYNNIVPYVYISNRVNSYSFKPTRHYRSARLFPNLKGYAIVTYDEVNTKIAQLEESFSEIPTCIFDNLNDAINWSGHIITSP